jgi:hypothetical protein
MTTLENNPLRDLNNARNLLRDTPETDAKATTRIGFFSCATVPAEFARQLERERNQTKENMKAASRGIERVSKLNQFLMAELVSARKERDAARAECERLSNIRSAE